MDIFSTERELTRKFTKPYVVTRQKGKISTCDLFELSSVFIRFYHFFNGYITLSVILTRVRFEFVLKIESVEMAHKIAK